MKNKYRVVRDGWNGYEAQFKPWYWPFWSMVNGCNTYTSKDKAIRGCEIHAGSIVWEGNPSEQE